MKHYIKNSVFDYLLCVVMTVCVAINVFQGFYLPAAQQYDVLGVALIAIALNALFFLFAYNKRTIIIGIVLFIALAAGAIVYAQAQSLFADDAASIGYMFGFLTFVSAFCVFMLSRTRLSCVFLFIFGTLLLAVLVFLGYEYFLPAYLAFLWAAGVMFFLKSYRRNVLRTNTAKTSFPRWFVITSIVSAIVLCVGAGAYALLVKPLNPPTRDLKLITKLMSLEVLQKMGVSSTIYLIDPDKLAENPNDDHITSPDRNDENKQTPQTDDPAPEQKPPPSYDEQFDTSISDQLLAAISYLQTDYRGLWLAIGIPLAIAAAILLKKLQRRLWFARMAKKERARQITALYQWYLKRFKKIGFGRSAYDTPCEYAERLGDRLRVFDNGDATISSVTDVFTKVSYGALPASDREYELVVSYYKNFYKGCRHCLGNVRYALRFFAL